MGGPRDGLPSFLGAIHSVALQLTIAIGKMRFLLKYKTLLFVMLTMVFHTSFNEPVLTQLNVSNTTSFRWRVEPFYLYRKDGQPGRAIRIFLKQTSFKDIIYVKITCNAVTETTTFNNIDDVDGLLLLLPAGVGVNQSAIADISVTTGDRTFSDIIHVPLKKQWTVYIYPHSHLDIGYTALPDNVKKLQVRNIDVGIDLAEKTQNYPEGARFIWNPEATWVVQHYLEQASPGQKQKFIEAVRKGWVQLDGGHSNSNTSTCSDEEMLHFFKNTSSIQKITGTPITSMVQMDVAGVAWGLVTAASEFGIKRIINFPNTFDLRKYWEHKPFYWLGPDGKTKTLFLQGFPYGIGYTIKGSKYGLTKIQTYTDQYDRVSTSTPLKDFIDPFIFEETAKLENSGSPYDLFAMTWSMADNCVIDADLPEAVKEWNAKYAYPKLIISGTKEILDAYEKKYASVIPTYSGDFTEFWTNGLGSDAVSVGEGREAKEQLVQAEILSSMLHTTNDQEKSDKAWEDQLLSAEHTWGAQNSESLLAQQVEKIKSGYFTNSKKESEELIAKAVASYKDTTVSSFSVINTLSWERNGIISLTKTQSASGDGVVDEENNPVLSQRLSTGELIFQAEHIPALGSKMYKVVAGKSTVQTDLVATSSSLSNDMISLQFNQTTGNITSVKNSQNGYEYADPSTGLNSYQYVAGVYNGKDFPRRPTTVWNVSMTIKEKGHLLVSMLIASNGDGVKKLNREVRVYHHSPVVELTNSFDKISTTDKEGIHFGFGFYLPDATGHIEVPWSIVSPNTDQLEGANKNWFAFQRWVDLSNKQYGITWSAIESPLLEWGSLSGNILDGARLYNLWQKQVQQSSTIYSWPLNNHWDTNFPLKQGGNMHQRYAFIIHGGYDVVAANRFGMETHRPLIVVQAKKNVISKPLVQISNSRLVISTMKKTADNKSVLLRIKSISDKSELLKLDWPSGRPKKIAKCGINEVPEQQSMKPLDIEPYGMMNLRIDF